jgi:hypothetical protein
MNRTLVVAGVIFGLLLALPFLLPLVGGGYLTGLLIKAMLRVSHRPKSACWLWKYQGSIWRRP